MALNTTPVTINGVVFNEHSPASCLFDFKSQMLTIPVNSWISSGDSAKRLPPANRGKVLVWIPAWDMAYPSQLDAFIAADPAGIADYTANYTSVPDYTAPVPTLTAFPAKPNAYHTWDWPTKTWILPANALAQAQADQVKTVTATYSAAIQAPVSYMATTFQADAGSQATLNKVITAANGTVPAGFYWVDAANNQVAMTFAQLQGLASAMWAQGWTAFQELQTKKAAIAAATTIAAVQAIV